MLTRRSPKDKNCHILVQVIEVIDHGFPLVPGKACCNKAQSRGELQLADFAT